MPGKHYQLSLGRNQRLAMHVLFDQGVWYPGAPYGVGTDGATGRIMESLHGRGLADRAPVHDGNRYSLSMAGYAWLIRNAAGDLSMTGFGSDAANVVADRIKHLAQCAYLTGVQGRPVDWRGNPV